METSSNLSQDIGKKDIGKKGLLIVFVIFIAALFFIFYFQGRTLRFFEGILDFVEIEQGPRTHSIVFQSDQTLNQSEIIFKNHQTIRFVNDTETRVFFVVLEGQEEVRIPVEPQTEGVFYRSRRFLSEERPFYIKDAEGQILAEGKIIAINR